MRKKPLILCSVIFFTTMLLSCTERIDLPLDEGSKKLVVEGVLSSDPGSAMVVLTETTPYYFNDRAPAVSGASVIISDGEAETALLETSPGVYKASSSFRGLPGRLYTLKIKLIDPLGGFTEYESAGKMEDPVILDSVYANFIPEFGEKGLWEARCWFQDPPSTDYYRFHLIRNSDVITWKLSKWLITDDSFFNDKYVNGETFTYLDQNSRNEELMPGDTLHVELYRISREYYYYIQDAQSELRGSNPLFSGPGANVRGSINNGAIGFFSVYPVTRAMYVVP